MKLNKNIKGYNVLSNIHLGDQVFLENTIAPTSSNVNLGTEHSRFGHIYTNGITSDTLHVSSGSFTSLSSQSVLSTNIAAVNTSMGNILTTNASVANLKVNDINTTNLLATTSSIQNLLTTNVSVANVKANDVNSSNILSTSLVATNTSIQNILTTNASVANLKATAIDSASGSVANLLATNATFGSVYANDMFVPGTLTTVNLTTQNLVDTNITSGTLLVNNALRSLSYNTLGNAYVNAISAANLRFNNVQAPLQFTGSNLSMSIGTGLTISAGQLITSIDNSTIKLDGNTGKMRADFKNFVKATSPLRTENYLEILDYFGVDSAAQLAGLLGVSESAIPDLFFLRFDYDNDFFELRNDKLALKGPTHSKGIAFWSNDILDTDSALQFDSTTASIHHSWKPVFQFSRVKLHRR
jgi:hypothetical protein